MIRMLIDKHQKVVANLDNNVVLIELTARRSFGHRFKVGTPILCNVNSDRRNDKALVAS